jgi:hypothetical protein
MVSAQCIVGQLLERGVGPRFSTIDVIPPDRQTTKVQPYSRAPHLLLSLAASPCTEAACWSWRRSGKDGDSDRESKMKMSRSGMIFLGDVSLLQAFVA